MTAYKITCSCGDTTTVRQGPDEIYVPDSPWWAFNTTQHWHCGREGHFMASSNPLPLHTPSHLQEES